MKKNLVALLIGVSALMIAACGTDKTNTDAPASTPKPTETVESTETTGEPESGDTTEATSEQETTESSKSEGEPEKAESSEETAESTGEPVSTDPAEETDSEWVGTWCEENLGMELTVTESENGYKYVINWPDPDNNMTFAWEIEGSENEAGVVAYSNGVASVIEQDESGTETTSVISEQEKGTFALLYDGTLQWVEEVEVEVEHIFVRK